MPAPASVPEFIDVLRKSRLLADEVLDGIVAGYQAAGTLPERLDVFASMLVRDGHLTFFQSKQLKLGKHKRFTIGSKYRLLELIGAGGMGAVYLCEHTLMRRLVALKILPVEKLEDESNKERFYREARAVAALDHPNIVRAYDIDQVDQLHFLVMEYVDGTSLQELVGRHGFLDPIRVAHYIAQSAVGMQHGHELGMVHRDIKPGNLLLDRSGLIKVLDMGLARFFNKPQDTVTEKYDDKCVLGTADYLAPEQAVSNIVDIRADIYSLGGTMYFLLTGQTPFPDGSIASKLVSHANRQVKPVSEYRSDVPPGMIAVLRKMMAKKPEDRFQEPIEVAEALAEWTSTPIDPPEAKLMPDLCPAILALTRSSAEKSSSKLVPLSRVLFRPDSGVFPGGSGSSERFRSGAKAALATAQATPRKAPPGPLSTARNSGSVTHPLPRRPARSDRPDALPIKSAITSAQRTLYLLLGLVAGVLLAGGLAVAYWSGGNRNNVTTRSSEPELPESVNSALTAEEAVIAPSIALGKVGQTVMVEFKVRSVNGNGPIYLNSEADERSASNFSVVLVSSAIGEAKRKLIHPRTLYLDKTIRVQGKVELIAQLDRDRTGIEVRSLKQISTIAANR